MQDAVIFNILQNSKWERPVYFALTSGTDRIGTDSFMELQGMTLEVTPIKKKTGGGYRINQKVLEEQLLSENVQPSKDFQRGFIFHNYNNPNINMEEQAQEMVDGIYRALYVMIARQISVVDKEKSKRYIETMEKRMPYSILTIRYDLLLDIFDIATYLNDEEKIKYYATFAENETLKKLARNPRDVESMSVLTMIYERNGQYEKALGIYNKYLEINPNDPTVKNRIASIQSIMKGDTIKSKGEK
jgi:tetratricopeptide (TPR) repeat protein